MTDIFFHDPGATLDYTFDWDGFLNPSESLSTSTWTVSVGMTTSGASYAARSATVFVSGGVAGSLYTLTNQISTSGGRSTSRSALLYSVAVPAGAGQVSIEEAKAGINYSPGADDTELAGWLRASVQLAEREVGPIAPTLVTDTFDSPPFDCTSEPGFGYPASLYVRQTPVIAVVSVDSFVNPAALYASSDVVADPTSGRLRLRTGLGFEVPWGGYTVTYIAGRVEVPEHIRKAILIILDHLWMSQRGWQSAAPNLRGELPSQPGVPAGFALPNRAAELLSVSPRYAVG